tara:strand:- start:23167 stop:23763 length:597 start_codon:yes stop_codon:yes gene_type:complete
MRDRGPTYQPYEVGLDESAGDGLDEEVHYPMVRQISALDEIRKHPGITSAVVAVLAGVGLATLLLNQRSGPTRFEQLRGRINPRGWVDTGALRDQFGHLARSVRQGLDDAGERAGDLGEETRDRADRWYRDARRSSRKTLKRHGKTARRYADQADGYARSHAREGGAILAIITIAAAVGAAALESRRSNAPTRSSTRY